MQKGFELFIIKNLGSLATFLRLTAQLPFSFLEPMKKAEQIQGKSISGVLEQLQKDRTLVKMHLLGKDYDRLTIVTDIRTRNKVPFFLVDYPPGFREAIAGVEHWKIHFEFTGKDNIQYVFRTSGGEIFRDQIWIRFPDSITREQRRKYFRLTVPSGAKIRFERNSITYEINVVDVSLGGCLGVLAASHERIKGKEFLRTGETLRHIQLEFPSEEGAMKVYIKEALISRREKAPVTGRYRYGLEFTKIEENEEKVLTELIYRFQREFLRERLPMGDFE